MKNRNLIFVALVSIVTLGLYLIYWLYSTRKEMVKMGEKIRPFWMLFVPLLVIIVGFSASVVLFTQDDSGPVASIGILMLLAFIAAIVVTILFLSSYCKAVENVTKKELTYGFNFALVIILSIVGIPLIWNLVNQYHFNRLSSPKDQIPDTPYPEANSPTPAQ